MVQSHSQTLERESLETKLEVMWSYSQALGHCLLTYKSPGMKLEMVSVVERTLTFGQFFQVFDTSMARSTRVALVQRGRLERESVLRNK